MDSVYCTYNAYIYSISCMWTFSWNLNEYVWIIFNRNIQNFKKRTFQQNYFFVKFDINDYMVFKYWTDASIVVKTVQRKMRPIRNSGQYVSSFNRKILFDISCWSKKINKCFHSIKHCDTLWERIFFIPKHCEYKFGMVGMLWNEWVLLHFLHAIEKQTMIYMYYNLIISNHKSIYNNIFHFGRAEKNVMPPYPYILLPYSS